MSKKGLRVALLLLDKMDRTNHLTTELKYLLEESGHMVFYSEKSMSDFGTSEKHLADHVKKTEADAWVIISGSRWVLQWFSGQDVSAFALFGRRSDLTLASAGPDKASAVSAATRKLIDLGHRRIALLCREQRRLPEPGQSERAFLSVLAEAGIETGTFNLPDWKQGKEGFLAMLDSLFSHTPPTALIADEAFLFNTAYFFLTHRGLHIPKDVSLVCTDDDPSFAWCQPSVAHIRWDTRPVINRVVRWVKNISGMREDRRQTLTKATFVEGGTIGSAR